MWEATSGVEWLEEDEETARTVGEPLKPCGVVVVTVQGKMWELLIGVNLVWDGKSLVAAGWF